MLIAWVLQFVTRGILFSTAGLLAWTALNPYYRWRARKIPGPLALPFLGNLAQVIKHDLTPYLRMLTEQYGKATKMWSGSLPLVVVGDVDKGRHLCLKYTSRPDLSSLSLRYGRVKTIWDHQLLFLTDAAKWRPIRRVFEATVLTPAALAAQAPFVSKATARLLDAVSAQARSGQPVEIMRAASNLTMDVIAWATFGLDLHATDAQPAAGNSGSGLSDVQLMRDTEWWSRYQPTSSEFGTRLAAAARLVMGSMDDASASVYNPLGVLFPLFRPLFKLMARYLPDQKKKDEIQALKALAAAVQVLIDEWRRQSGSSGGAAPAGGSPSGKQGGMSELGFLSRLLSGKDLEKGEEFNDNIIIANAQFMLIAGYDTTAATISMTLHYLATNPDKQQALHQELDSKLHGRMAQVDDLEHLPYCCAVVDETLRLHPAGSVIVRENSTAHSIDIGNGIMVPPKLPLAIPNYTYQRDPAIWPEAEKFLPERWLPDHKHLAPSNPHAYLPFGVGSRMCVGYKLAQLEVRMAVARLMQRFAVSTVPGAPPLVLRTSLVYKPNRVDLMFTERSQQV